MYKDLYKPRCSHCATYIISTTYGEVIFSGSFCSEECRIDSIEYEERRRKKKISASTPCNPEKRWYD